MSYILKNGIILLYAYPFGFFISSLFLRKILVFIDSESEKKLGGLGIHIKNESFWIGACEHFLVITFILLDQYTALGIIFAARGIVRMEDIKKKASFYLLGMLLSLCFAVFFGVTAKTLFDI